MKQKSIAFLLLTCLLCSLFPIQLWAIERDDTTNIAAKDYAEDTYIFTEYDGDKGVSSGDPLRWNGIYPAGKQTSVDPIDAQNKLSHAYHSATFSLHKNMNYASGTYMAGTTLVLASPEGITPSNITVSLHGKTVLYLSYKGATESYTYNFMGEQTGTVPKDTYLRLNMLVVPEGSTSKATLKVTAQGQFSDSDKGECAYLTTSTATVDYKSNTNLSYTATPNASEAHLYVDDTYLLTPGDFAPSTITLESAGDTFFNYVLDGKVTVKLYHEPDPATFDIANVRLCNKAGEDVPFTSLAYSYAHPDTLLFDFGGDALAPNTDYYVHFGEGVKDILGGEMYEKVAKFSTKANPGDIPPLELVALPKEGFVMPDTWNTGYRCHFDELVPLGEKYTEFASGYNFVITEAIARKYNYEFSHFKGEGVIYVTATSPVYIHDFYWNGNMRNGRPGSTTFSERLTVAWGEGTCSSELIKLQVANLNDFFGGQNLTVTHCYLHDLPADMMKSNSGQIITYNYFRDGGTRSPGAHADGIQFYYGSLYTSAQDIKYIGNRIDMPHLGYDHVSNSPYFFTPDKPQANVQAVGNWLNGGGYTIYLGPGCGVENCYNIVFNHNKIGYGYKYGPYANSYGLDEHGNPNLAQYGGSCVGSGLVTTLDTGSVVYFSGEANKDNRVFDMADMDATTGAVMVNFANYMLMARGYRIEVSVLDAYGNVVSTATKEGEIRRYIPPKEYEDPSNLKDSGFINPDNNQPIPQLIVMPDLPQNVEEYVTLSGLPEDLTGHSISVSVYDTYDGDKLIRTSTLTDKVTDNCRPNAEKFEVKFVDGGKVIATKYVELGESATPPEAPQKEGYVFEGWSGIYTNVQGNVTITAQYTKLLTVKITDMDGTVLATHYVKSGESVSLPTPPAHENYEFLGWSSSGQNIQKDTTIKAMYEWITSDALKAFKTQVEVLEGTSVTQFSKCFATLKRTEAMWNSLENKEEIGADALYSRFMTMVSAYNRAVNAVNETMADAIHLSCTTLDRGQNQVALHAVYQSLK